MAKMTPLGALRALMHRQDELAPEGGRQLGLAELQELTKEERDELGRLAATELGVEIEEKQ
jgi:hypothetical protein